MCEPLLGLARISTKSVETTASVIYGGPERYTSSSTLAT